MSITTQITYKELTTFLNNSSYSTQLVIVPYSWVDLGNGKKQCYTIVLHGINGFLRDFGGTVSRKTAIHSYISSSLDNESLGVIQVSADEIAKTASIFVDIQTNYDDSKSLDPRSLITVFVNLGDSNKSVLNSLIEAYANKLKKSIRHYPNKSDYNTNLVYLSQLDLFYICRGTSYTVEDDKGDFYNIDVGDGMFLDDDIIAIYRPKPGDIPASRFVSNGANAPFSFARYTDVSTTLAGAINDIFNDDSLEPFRV